MTIYLTEPKDLTAGLWWARQGKLDCDYKKGAWSIAQVTGTFPFLRVCIVLYCRPSGEWVGPREELSYIENPADYEFGPRIDVPSNKDTVEWMPQERPRETTP